MLTKLKTLTAIALGLSISAAAYAAAPSSPTNFDSSLGWDNTGASESWNLHTGKTSSWSTGPATGAGGSGNYAYFETSSAQANTHGEQAFFID